MTATDGRTADAAPGSTTAETDAQIMARHGIVRRPVDYFHVGEYRYTNLEDAVAAAKRTVGRI